MFLQSYIHVYTDNTIILYINLSEECYVERESKRVIQSDLLRELSAEFPGRCGRVAEKGLCVAVHEGDREH